MIIHIYMTVCIYVIGKYYKGRYGGRDKLTNKEDTFAAIAYVVDEHVYEFVLFRSYSIKFLTCLVTWHSAFFH